MTTHFGDAIKTRHTIFQLRIRALLCIGSSLFFLALGGFLLHDHIAARTLPYIVVPVGFLFYFLSWIAYPHRAGKLVVVLSAAGLIALVVAMILNG